MELDQFGKRLDGFLPDCKDWILEQLDEEFNVLFIHEVWLESPAEVKEYLYCTCSDSPILISGQFKDSRDCGLRESLNP